MPSVSMLNVLMLNAESHYDELFNAEYLMLSVFK
jgi:hypothetical protein